MIVEEQELLREGLALMIGRVPEFEVVGVAGSAEEALERWPLARPDQVVLDLLLPGMGGADLCRALKALDPSVQLVILSGHEELRAVLEAVQAGACAYLPKDIGAREFLEALRRVRAEGSMLEPFLANRLLAELRRPPGASPPAAVPADPGSALSARETEILRQLAVGASNKEIASQLSISNFTVANHLKSIYRKLGVKDRVQATRAAMSRGLL